MPEFRSKRCPRQVNPVGRHFFVHRIGARASATNAILVHYLRLRAPMAARIPGRSRREACEGLARGLHRVIKNDEPMPDQTTVFE